MNIRPETPADYDAIAEVVTAAASVNDARLVELIRASDNYLPALALIAESEPAIVGHILFSYVELRGSWTTRVLALAPRRSRQPISERASARRSSKLA